MCIRGKKRQAEGVVSGNRAALSSSVGGGGLLPFKAAESLQKEVQSYQEAEPLSPWAFSDHRVLQLSSGIVVTLLAPAEEATKQIAHPFCVHLSSTYTCLVRCRYFCCASVIQVPVPPTGDTDVLVSFYVLSVS